MPRDDHGAVKETIVVTACPVCGRDDRVQNLKTGAGRHFSRGERCTGDPQRYEYRLVGKAAE
jgi:hypothetical protein